MKLTNDDLTEVTRLVANQCKRDLYDDEDEIFNEVIEIIGLKIRVRLEEQKNNSVLFYETDHWVIEDTFDDQFKIKTDDQDRFENDMCLIKMALAR